MYLLQIRYFLRLAERRHFWQTAEYLSITQSALSRHIQSMERELGFLLFERDRRNVRLTAAGRLLQTEWTRLLAELEAVQHQAHQMSSGEVGSLRIGHHGSIAYGWLPRLLARFTARYPLVKLDLLEVVAAYPEQHLLTYRLDVGMWREPARSPALQSEEVFSDSLALVVPASHPVRSETFCSLAAVRDEPFVLPPLDDVSIPHARALLALFVYYKFSPRVALTSHYGATILNLVAAGLGVSVLPLSYAGGTIQGVRFIELPHTSAVHMVWRRDDDSAVLHHLLAETRDRAAQC
ncbi:MAG TPA: LysR substrate-binding domain-containing protein [Hymenobacter sp.]|nr:LysR substrate-binding domain-containing protein [Hymenobacter sp.]